MSRDTIETNTVRILGNIAGAIFELDNIGASPEFTQYSEYLDELADELKRIAKMMLSLEKDRENEQTRKRRI